MTDTPWKIILRKYKWKEKRIWPGENLKTPVMMGWEKKGSQKKRLTMKWEKRTNILRLEEKFVRRGRLE
jgi:hypothetical protein